MPRQLAWWQRRDFRATDISIAYRDDDRSLAEKYGKMIAPRFKVEISGADEEVIFSSESIVQDNGFDVNGLIVNDVEYEYDIEGADTLNITFNNPKLDLQDTWLLAEGNNIDLWMSYDNRAWIYMGRGIIVEIQTEFPVDTMPTIKVTAYDKSYFMMEEGKAEIDPEGSTWWERRRQSAQATEDEVDVQTVLDTYPSTADGVAENRRINADLERQGRTERVPEITYEEAARNNFPTGSSRDISEITYRKIQDNLDATDEAHASLHNRSRAGWQRSRFPRRRRNAGKVWQGKTDSEIAEALFNSYQITPFTEATHETTRSGVLNTTVDDNVTRGERSGRPSADPNAFVGPPDITFVGPPRKIDEDISPRSYSRYARNRERSFLSSTLPERMIRKVTQKAGTSDWDFLKQLAKSHGFIVFVFYSMELRRWVGYWGSEDNVPQNREYLFKYNTGESSTLGTVRPNISLKNQSTEIDLIFVDPISRKTNRLRVSMDNVTPQSPRFRFNDAALAVGDASIGDGPEVLLNVHGQRVRVNANRRFTNAEDARQWLISFWLEHARDFMFVEGNTIIGIPELQGRQYHEIRGIGRFSSRFFFTNVRHRMTPGSIYNTSFTARKVVSFNEGQDDFDIVNDQTNIGEAQREV